ncbi:HPr family phosphocarrier protein [Aquibacillus albus]|uniref:Phosphotransferase system HPr (HPr) family protein n=1 Tax=Aquibacillus albus TaxID=1168171 RepID=A0ABS2N4D7_9BACI|nr:HPr family phosphocarrier protein [Aquibacillus albus]MBM7573011.1 phosphotransferase system HPr (HPr) family protein [Aquibacillus albus]
MYVKEIKVNRFMNTHDIVELTNLASKFESDITLEFKHYKIDVKSILGLLSLYLDKGLEVSIITKGDDDREAMIAISHFFEGAK